MPQSMAAVVDHGPGDYRLEVLPRAHARPGEVVIQVEAAGICGNDVKCHAGAEMFWGGPDPWIKPPVIPGHEFFGTVVEALVTHRLPLGDFEQGLELVAAGEAIKVMPEPGEGGA